jgi:PTS system mannose-specific IIA component
MTGILVVTHGNLASTLIETLDFIMGKEQDRVLPISIDIKEDPDNLRKKIKQAISTVSSDKGVLIFTDMFGGTPSNLAYSFLDEGKIEVISGVNLPLLLKAVTARKKSMDMETLANLLVEHGKRSISLASGILKGTKRS